MDINEATKTLEALANGTDISTGTNIPPDSPYNTPGIIRALFTCVDHIKHPPREKRERKSPAEKLAENIKKGLPRNSGLPWTKDARSQLAEGFRAGTGTRELASRFERTNGAIVAELKKQGLISEEEAERLNQASK